VQRGRLKRWGDEALTIPMHAAGGD